MIVKCMHGYFTFEETKPGQISEFSSLFGLDIEQDGDHFTFSDLVDAPQYAIAGGLFLNAIAIKTFEGRPWDVMRENRLVYDFNKGLIIPIDLVLNPIKIKAAGNVYITTGMIMPGSLTDEGLRVTDYAAFYNFEKSVFKYTGISYGETP